MKHTEAELHLMLEKHGLPVWGTHADLVERAERNGLIKAEKAVDAESQDDADKPKRGRPKKVESDDES